MDIFVRPISAENNKRGWAIAHYLVAQADRLDIQTVIFDDRIWKAGDGAEWRENTTRRHAPVIELSSSIGTTSTSTSSPRRTLSAGRAAGGQ